MGAVCRARDTRLNREVALKVLRASANADSASVRRLERLFEMNTGRQLFSATTAAVLSAAMKAREPAAAALVRGQLPAGLEPLVLKALEPDPDIRYQTAADVRADLKRLKRELESGALPMSAPALAERETPEPAPAAQRRMAIAWIAATAVSVLLAVVGWFRLPGTGVTRPFALSIVPPSGVEMRAGGIATPDISPDGRAVLFAATRGLYVRRLDSVSATRIPGSERATNAPFWSAASDAVVYPVSDGGLMKVRLPLFT
jgi:hypothetical protein